MMYMILFIFLALYFDNKTIVSFWSGLSLLIMMLWMDMETLIMIEWSTMSWLLLFLVWFLTPIIMLSSLDFKYNSLYYLYSVLVLLVMISFLVDSLLMFYILFELSVIPMSILVLGWGLQPERMSATLYMFLYTIISSFPFIVVLLNYYNTTNLLVSYLMLIPFLVKIPVYLVHIWLPKAHVEAPVFGSMFLAAVMLKVGVYGVYRVSATLMSSAPMYMGAYSFIGGAVCSVMMITQTDLKSMIAYSSVVHMSCLLGSVLCLNVLGVLGALMMSLAHGACSAGLFYTVTSQYQLIGSRSILMSSGMISLLPLLTMLWSLMLMMNLSAPPSMSLYSELLMFSSWLMISKISLMLISVMILFVLVYSLILFFSLNHGQMIKMMSVNLSSFKEYLVMLLLAHFMFTSVLFLSWV